jgi:hypothetical protein
VVGTGFYVGWLFLSSRPVGDRLCSLIMSAGYRWIKSQAWIPDFDTCEPLASLE